MHHNALATAFYLNFKYDKCKAVQGFLTSENRFVNRTEALKIASAAGQIPEGNKHNPVEVLLSEDIY